MIVTLRATITAYAGKRHCSECARPCKGEYRVTPHTGEPPSIVCTEHANTAMGYAYRHSHTCRI